MTMPVTEVGGGMAEDALLEAEIQQQLELIDLDTDDDANNNTLMDDGNNPMVDVADEFSSDLAMDYLSRLQKQTDRFEEELNGCDDLINHHNLDIENGDVSNMEELVEAAELSGVDPKELRKRILEAIDNDDLVEAEEVEDVKDGGSTDTPIDSQQHDPVPDTVDESEENISLNPAEGVVALVDEIQTQEAFFKQQLRDLDMKYKEREDKRKQVTDTRRKEEEERENSENEKRQQKLQKYEVEKQALEQEQKVAQQRLEAEVEEKRLIIQTEVKKFEEQITQLETETRREQEELEKSVLERQEKHKQQENTSATTLQAAYRGYRVRITSQPILNVKREERRKAKEQKRIDEIEKEIQERKEAEIKAKEKVEAEKKQIEEQKRKIEEEKIKEEERKLEEKRKEEEKRLAEEKQKREIEEKRKREIEEKQKEEERKRKEEEERKQQEEIEKKRQEKLEEEKRERERKLEEERKKKEAELLAEEEKKREIEEKRKQEEKKIEEERLQKEKEDCTREEKLVEEKTKSENNETVENNKQVKSDQSEEEKLRQENEKLKEELRKMKEGTKSQQVLEESKENVERVIVTDNKSENKSPKQMNLAKRDNSPEDLRRSLTQKQQEFEKSRAEEMRKTSAGTLGGTLPQHIEDRRLTWIKECLPWSKISNEPWKLKGGVSKKPPRRPSSAKKLPPLAESSIIAAARVATLKQVTTVELSDLPGCSLSTLGQCWGLKSLSMTRCNLVALDGLHQCKQLQYLNMKNNKLEYVDVKDLGSLQFVDLSHNNLAVVHGLDGCTNIRWLDLSHNRITRLSGLDPLRRLHTLKLSHNQLISCSSVSDVPTLQQLDLSHNHLQDILGLHKLCLLQRLNVSGNNLLQFPDLGNHVLLELCDVSDNSVSSLQSLSSHWLPMLSTLNVSKNSVNELVTLDNLLLLRSLDVSNNQLLDLETISSALKCHHYLEELSIGENPATEDPTNFSGELAKLLPRLQKLDGTNVKPSESGTLEPSTDFETMCRTHAQFQAAVRNVFNQDLQSTESKSPVDSLALCEMYFRYCDKSFKLAVDHRYAHEYGEISVNVPAAPTTPRSGRPRSSRARMPTSESYLSPKEMFEKALQSDTKSSATESQIGDQSNPKDLFEKALTSNLNPKDLFQKALESSGNPSVARDSHPKGQFMQALELKSSPRDAVVEMPGNPTSDTIIDTRASLQNLSSEDMAILEELHTAATKIQALWRGYYLRLRLSAALEYARLEEDDDVSELDDFNMDDIAFDEESLEKGWRPTNTPNIPHSHPVVGKPPSGRQGGAADVFKLELAPVNPPNPPRQAWRNIDSPLSDLHHPRPPSSVRTGTDTHRSNLSKREEKVAEEWGFHSSRTAELMMQRARKMKLNSDRKKKISRLDPKQRLALFRKLEESAKLSPIRPPIRKTLPRKEYFQAREDEMKRKDYEKRQEANTRSTRTYEWLHTQVSGFDNYDSGEKTSAMYGGDQAVADFIAARKKLTRGFSHDTDSQDRRARRFSSSDTTSNTGQTTHLPPIKTSSAGSGGSGGGGSRKKEKMSWRNKPTEADVGWGGGRKRLK